jgi:hypothetical protein
VLGRPGQAELVTEKPSLDDVLSNAPWLSLEEHLNVMPGRVDASIHTAHKLREQFREELLQTQPELLSKITRPSTKALKKAEAVFRRGTVAAADGTISPVPLVAGTKIQVGVVIVSNRGEVVDLVTRVFETELATTGGTATEFFSTLRRTRAISNLLSRAVMLFGERKLLIEHPADWRMVHGELIPHELRTGAGRPERNLPPTFELIHRYINSETFLAVSEASDDIDILNAAVLLQPGEYIVIRSMTDTLEVFLDGDQATQQAAANFVQRDKERFRQFIAKVGPKAAVVLVKAGQKPFLIECHSERIEEAVAMFLVDALWTRGHSVDAENYAVRGFPFHIDLADQVARTLFKGSDFRNFVEVRLLELGVEAGLFDMDPRRLRV